jgi:hypothetical protein
MAEYFISPQAESQAGYWLKSTDTLKCGFFSCSVYCAIDFVAIPSGFFICCFES